MIGVMPFRDRENMPQGNAGLRIPVRGGCFVWVGDRVEEVELVDYHQG